MIKSLITGLIALIICLGVGIYEQSLSGLMKAAAIATGILIGLAILLSGTLVKGDRGRANDASETVEDRQGRIKRVEFLIVASLPCLLVTAIIYFVSR